MYIHIYTRICIYVCMYTCIHVYTYIYVYNYLYIHACVHICRVRGNIGRKLCGSRSGDQPMSRNAVSKPTGVEVA